MSKPVEDQAAKAVETFASQRKALVGYVSGFVLSLALTLISYSLAIRHSLSGWSFAYAVLALGSVQLVVQLVCFLHLGQEREPRWRLLVFDFTLLVLVIVVIGSLWIMEHLNYHNMDMTPSETNTYLRDHEGL